MGSRVIIAAAIALGLGLAACESTPAGTDGPTVSDAQKGYEAIEAKVRTASADGSEAARAVIRDNRQALTEMTAQDCTGIPNGLARLDCQYDAAGAAFFLAHVTAYDADPGLDGAFDPFTTARKYAGQASTTCRSVEDQGRCAISEEIGRLAPVLAELRDLRVAAEESGVRSVASWGELKNNMFRVSETIHAGWSTPPNLPETVFLTDGRRAAGCGIVDATSKIGFTHDRNTFDDSGAEQLTEEQKVAYGAYYQQRQAAMLAIAHKVVPAAEGATPTDDQMREALIRKCASNVIGG